MNPFKIFIILVVFIGTPKFGKCSDYASWWQKTPYNNEICYENINDNYTIGIKCEKSNDNVNEFGHVISDITKWYFYRKYIIGEFIKEEKTNFFIFDELKCIKQTFDSKSEFEIQLKKLKLKPILWTRWYNSNWGVILTNGNIADSFISVFIILPIILITTIVFLVRLIRSKFNFKNIYNKIILVIIGIFILRIILDIYPNSI